MKKRVFLCIFLPAGIALVVFSYVFCLMFYRQFFADSSDGAYIFPWLIPIDAVLLVALALVCRLLAKRLTAQILLPINRAADDPAQLAPYDELLPFMRMLERQQRYIADRLEDLQMRSVTLGAIMDNMNEGIILTDNKSVIISANKSVLRIFDKSFPLDGKNLLEIFRDMDFSANVRAALEGKSAEMNLEREGKIYQVRFSHVYGGGAIILFLDITENALSEKLRSEFSANVSHELKTPITSIYGNAEMLSHGMVREADKAAFYGQIKEEAARLMALIDDILMISKLDEGRAREACENLALIEVANEAAAALRQKAAEAKISISVSGEERFMIANRSLIFDMLFNLIDNAIKYNKPGGSVAVSISGSPDLTVISVSDTGIGIPRESQQRVFERFYRVDKSRSKKTGGTGLGLAIVKHIVRTEGGKLELLSREGEGTTIRIKFPSDPGMNTLYSLATNYRLSAKTGDSPPSADGA